mmetsp:Transcript_32883/g.40384  ORF Transcript_32883/g.40384 Transcript_32883/m.40384 type:complete len:376 (-) Transcript_32883:142-1269(-)
MIMILNLNIFITTACFLVTSYSHTTTGAVITEKEQLSLRGGRQLQNYCGNGNRRNGICADGTCCSQYGWCGTSSSHCTGSKTCGGGSVGDGVCADGTCCSQYGWCGTSSSHCGTGSRTCGGGSIGDGVCADGSCCSKYGWCGTSSSHCTRSKPRGGSLSLSISSPPKILALNEIQVGIDVYNGFFGGDARADQTIANLINEATNDVNKGWTIYRQLAFVAQTIWESGAYRYTEEIAAVEPPYTNRNNYQDCDWNTDGIQYPDNGKAFYGRGYIQLSWCANYKAYGRGRMINGDPDYFYKNPELVATTYAMDSAAWIFENNVHDTSGRFGDTTDDINGAIECRAHGYTGNAPQRRYQIFDALAKEVGLTGYSSAGC